VFVHKAQSMGARTWGLLASGHELASFGYNNFHNLDCWFRPSTPEVPTVPQQHEELEEGLVIEFIEGGRVPAS